MIFELTRDYAIVVPLMIANLVSFAISRRFQRVPVYDALARQDGIHLPRHARERVQGEGLNVIDIMTSNYAIVRPDAVVEDLPSGVDAWVVVDQDRVLGAVAADGQAARRQAVRATQSVRTLLPAVTASHVHPDHPIEDALERMQDAEAQAIVVLERGDPDIAGIVTERRILEAFGVKVSEQS
jgi:CIC family chloride channel protein